MHTDDEINAGLLLRVVFPAILNRRDSVYVGHSNAPSAVCVHKVRSGGREDRWGSTKGGLLKTGQEEVLCIKMAEEKWETNAQMAGLDNLPYFPWVTAIGASAKGSGQRFCCCWTHVNVSTSGCGFNTSALRLNQCRGCVFAPSSNARPGLWFLPRPPRVAPRPRTTPAGAAPPTPFPMSLSTATLFTDMEKFLCGER